MRGLLPKISNLKKVVTRPPLTVGRFEDCGYASETVGARKKVEDRGPGRLRISCSWRTFRHRPRRMLNRSVPLFFVAVFAFAWGTKGARGQSTTAEAWPATGQAVPGDGLSGIGPSRSEGFISSFATSFPGPSAEPWKEPSPPPLTVGLPAAPATPLAPGETRPDEDHGPGPLEQALCHEPLWGLQSLVSYDSWKGLSDGGWQNNGINVGANFGMLLGEWGDSHRCWVSNRWQRDRRRLVRQRLRCRRDTGVYHLRPFS